MSRSDRIAKYNQLLRIEQEPGRKRRLWRQNEEFSVFSKSGK